MSEKTTEEKPKQRPPFKIVLPRREPAKRGGKES